MSNFVSKIKNKYERIKLHVTIKQTKKELYGKFNDRLKCYVVWVLFVFPTYLSSSFITSFQMLNKLKNICVGDLSNVYDIYKLLSSV